MIEYSTLDYNSSKVVSSDAVCSMPICRENLNALCFQFLGFCCYVLFSMGDRTDHVLLDFHVFHYFPTYYRSGYYCSFYVQLQHDVSTDGAKS